jgi:hypothetical protein
VNQQQLLDVTVDAHARRDEDFYSTPVWMTRALLRRIYMGRWTVLEPCCGDGAIVRELTRLQDVTVLTNDVVARAPMVPEFLLDATQASSWKAFAAACPYIDLTLTNTPFDEAIAIVQHAWKHSRQGVICLQRCTWIEPTNDRGEWLAKHPPAAQIIMPRWNFRSTDGKGGGDSAPASWFVWNKAMQLCAPGIHVVTKGERDELIAAERMAR